MTYFFFDKEHHDFGTKEEKSETDSKRRPFFFGEHCDFGTKKEKSETQSRQRPFFLENTMILGQKLVFVLESQTIILIYVNVIYEKIVFVVQSIEMVQKIFQYETKSKLLFNNV